MRTLLILVASVALLWSSTVLAGPPATTTTPSTTTTTTTSSTPVGLSWEHYGASVQGDRYSSLTQITKSNVETLEPKWCYQYGRSGYGDSEDLEAAHEMTPIVTDNGGGNGAAGRVGMRQLMYMCTPFNVVIAVDAATGEKVWEQSDLKNRLSHKLNTCRGVSTWDNPNIKQGEMCRRTIFVATLSGRLGALDAATGQLCPGFGEGGSIQVIPPRKEKTESGRLPYGITSPPLVVNNTLLVGSGISDTLKQNISKGHVNAYDPIHGTLLWQWSAVPEHNDDPGAKSWGSSSSSSSSGSAGGAGPTQFGAGSVWSVMAAYPPAGLVYLPTSSPSLSAYGVGRSGSNLYTNSIVALHVKTGKMAWSYQTVHHDLWGYGMAAQPTVVTLPVKGQATPCVVVWTKMGYLFVLNAITGQAVFAIDEVPAPRSDVPGEQPWPSQPRPHGDLGSLIPHVFNESMAWGRNDAERGKCREQVLALKGRQKGAIFTPPSLQGSVHYPSALGGATWGSVAVDPEHGMAYFTANNFAMQTALIPHGQDKPMWCAQEWTRSPMHGSPYTLCKSPLSTHEDGSGLPCNPPPWATLMGVDLNSGKLQWRVPYGSTPEVMDHPEYGSKKVLGGVAATASGLLFGAGTLDQHLRAIDAKTGMTIWTSETLPTVATATPAVYQVEGQEYIAINAGGNPALQYGVTGDYVFVYGLHQGSGPPNTLQQVCPGVGAGSAKELKQEDVAAEREDVMSEGKQRSRTIISDSAAARLGVAEGQSAAAAADSSAAAAAAAAAASGSVTADPLAGAAAPMTATPSASTSTTADAAGPAATPNALASLEDINPTTAAAGIASPASSSSSSSGSGSAAAAAAGADGALSRAEIEKAQAEIEMGALEIHEGKKQVQQARVQSANAHHDIEVGEKMVVQARQLEEYDYKLMKAQEKKEQAAAAAAAGSGSGSASGSASGSNPTPSTSTSGSGSPVNVAAITTKILDSAAHSIEYEGQSLITQGKAELKTAARAVTAGQVMVRTAEGDIARGQAILHGHGAEDDVRVNTREEGQEGLWTSSQVLGLCTLVVACCLGVLMLMFVARKPILRYLGGRDRADRALLPIRRRPGMEGSPGSGEYNKDQYIFLEQGVDIDEET
eukprot:TRINITY_DN2117_c0_g1_i1.p1 TRINITY_DN2117_c0_g1~~TRINITY_DN2117_c0_g1_i1.p1  ORF type:complete len:1127 (-),score=319.99 TRINITY_DN2117_c0_g1_i1:18-3398(-)